MALLIGARIRAALDALADPTLRADLDANTAGDAAQSALLDTLGTTTTELRELIDALSETVAAGGTIDPAAFADIQAKVASLDEAFPEPTDGGDEAGTNAA